MAKSFQIVASDGSDVDLLLGAGENLFASEEKAAAKAVALDLAGPRFEAKGAVVSGTFRGVDGSVAELNMRLELEPCDFTSLGAEGERMARIHTNRLNAHYRGARPSYSVQEVEAPRDLAAEQRKALAEFDV